MLARVADTGDSYRFTKQTGIHSERLDRSLGITYSSRISIKQLRDQVARELESQKSHRMTSLYNSSIAKKSRGRYAGFPQPTPTKYDRGSSKLSNPMNMSREISPPPMLLSTGEMNLS